VKEVLAELRGGPRGGYLGVNETLDKDKSGTDCRQEATMRSDADAATVVQPAEAREPGFGLLCISTRSESLSRG
jgi:hypothetical protein